MELLKVLEAAVQNHASDIHLTTGLPPVFRIHGNLVAQESYGMLTAGDTEKYSQQILGEARFSEFQKTGEVDLAFPVSGLGRFRVNIYKQRGSCSLAFRHINARVPRLDNLGLPGSVAGLARKNKGLVLVTGPAGSGKTTTLGAMVDQINRERSCHIITLEDPIEYLHRHQKSIVNQREVGSDSSSFQKALKAVLRQDPDVILVGEMRDLETIAIAVTAAETGHLVLASLHTGGAPQTIDRIIDVFPPHQQSQIRVQLAETLEGVIAQRLLPRIDQPGRVAAVEIMVATPAIRNLIREGKTHQILSSMQTGSRVGMQTFETAYQKLSQLGLINNEFWRREISSV